MTAVILTIVISVAAAFASYGMSLLLQPKSSYAKRQRAFWADWWEFMARAFSVGAGGNVKRVERQGVDSVGFVQAVAEKVLKDVEPPRGDWGDGSLADFEEATKNEADGGYETTGALLVKNGVVIAVRKSKRLETMDEPRKEPEGVRFDEFEDGF